MKMLLIFDSWILGCAVGCAAAGTIFSGCQTTCKIEPPQTAIGSNDQAKAEVAAHAISDAISGASAGADYQHIVNNTYATVGQDDIAFYLLLQAYNCESERGHASQAAQILQLAKTELARRHKSQKKKKLARN